jgi:hypothetical protein
MEDVVEIGYDVLGLEHDGPNVTCPRCDADDEVTVEWTRVGRVEVGLLYCDACDLLTAERML